MFPQPILFFVELFLIVVFVPETKLAQFPKFAIDLRRMLTSLEAEERRRLSFKGIGYGGVEFGKEAVFQFRVPWIGLQMVVDGLGNEPPPDTTDRR